MFIAQKNIIFFSPPFTWPQKGQFLLFFLKGHKNSLFLHIFNNQKRLIYFNNSGWKWEREFLFNKISVTENSQSQWLKISKVSQFHLKQFISQWTKEYLKMRQFCGIFDHCDLANNGGRSSKFKFLTTQLLFFAWNARHIIIHYSYPKAKRFSF